MQVQNIFEDTKARGLILRVLRENFGRYIWHYLLAMLLMACAALATALSAFMLQNITPVVFGSKEKAEQAPLLTSNSFAAEWTRRISEHVSSFIDTSHPGMFQILCISIGIILIFLVKGLSVYGSNVILTKVGNNLIARQQRRIGEHILGQSLAFFVRFPSSELLTRISYAAEAARQVMNLLMTRVQDLFTGIALLITMFKLDWRLSCVALFILGPISLILGYIIRRIRRIARSQYHNIAHVISAIHEAVLGSKLIRSYNLEPVMLKRFDVSITTVERLSNKLAVVSARTTPIMEIIGGIAVALIVFYGGYRNLVLGQDADKLIAFLFAMLLAYDPVKRIAKMNITLNASLVGVEALYNVLDADFSIPDAPDAKPLQLREGNITFQDVTFGYHPGQPVIHDISLSCKGGGVTALVGPSGSGKSTLFNLIERFYQADAGRIEIDGQDISQLQTTSLRDHLSLVSQDTFLFSDTLRNNIRFAKPDASDAEVEAAARAAFAHDFILEQPKGYDTEVGENGGNLSGGQRQRVSIARAFLKNAPILLLDEATSALDSESEQKIQIAFDQLMRGRTTIVIAHRFSTIRNASMIHVMHNGRLAASGCHDELMRDTGGLYAHLYKLQLHSDTSESQPSDS